MEKEILETVVTSFVGELFNQTAKLFEGTGDELKQFLNRGLKRYLEKQRDKYSHIKTLLKGNTPVYLYDIYYHLRLTNRKEVIETKSINTVFSKSNYITIIGDAGSGKSTLVKHLFLNSILEKSGIPILVELRYLNDYKNSFEDYIYEKIFENKLSQNSNILERLLTAGKFVFFLDGFDELNSDIKPSVIISLNSFINSYDQNKFILTTRPYS
ncbi:MAG: NACHT domain-containing protein, partial [Ignavibacteria bacterium]